MFSRMFNLLKNLWYGRRGDGFAETALIVPIVMLLTIGMVNLSIAGFASNNANNAANYGARAGSVAQQNAAGTAYSAAIRSLSNANVGEYQVGVTGGGFPGSQINVNVGWSVPNYMGGLMSFVGGGGSGSDFSGSANATFRQEGW